MYLPKLPDEEFDAPLGTSTGAGVIFGATGGVMEAALRTAKEWITGESGEAVEFGEVRGTEGIKEASYKIGDLELNVCVASGLKTPKKFWSRSNPARRTITLSRSWVAQAAA